MQPCIAFRSGGSAYLVSGRNTAAVFRVDTSSSPLSMRRDLTASNRAARVAGIQARKQELLSLGGDRFAPVVPVGTP